MRINRSSSLFGLFLLIGVTTLEAQPKIGLVLGGGGARGAAHVGVLKVLERNRIPVHCIAGTSMGAIIGGFYASGLNADEIEAVLTHIDWEDSFIDGPPRPNLSMRRKEDDLNFLIDLSVGFNGQALLLPRGLVQGQKQNRIFREIVQPVLHISDFDNLPTPFRAVATDIKEGQPVVLGTGSLVAAMRASMSIPAIFAPVELDHYLLVDGGITNNLPVDVIKQMGADIVIAVDVSAGLLPEEELNTALNITDQVSNIVMQQSNDLHKQLLSDRDVLIVPQLAEIGSADFLKVLRAVPKGEAAAQAQLDKLKSLALSEAEYAQYQQMRDQKRVHTSVEVDFIEINNDSKISSRIIRAQLATQPGETLDLQTLEQDIANIYSMDLFERVDAHLFNSDSGRGLKIDAKRKAWGPNYFNFGLDFTDDFGGGSAYNFVTRYTRTEINAMAAEWRSDLQVGEEPRLFSEFYQPLDVGLQYFLATSIELQQTGVDLFEQGERYAELRVNTRNFELQAGRMFSNWGELRLGVLRGDGETRLRTGDPGDFAGVEHRFDSGRYTLRFRYDTLDNVRFPTSGARVEFDADFSRAHLSGNKQPYDLYRLGWLKARTRGRHTFLTRVATGTLSKGAVNGFQNQFRLGGFLNLSGLNTDERVGAHFAIADIIFYRRFGSFEENLFNIPLYIGGSLELGNVWETRDDASIDNTLMAGSLFVGADTFLGPLYLAAGLTEGGYSGLYFFLGRSF